MTLQTFGPAVGLFKKNTAFSGHVITLSCPNVPYILGMGTRKVPALFGCRNFIGNLSCKFKISPNNYKLSIVL